MSHLLFGLRHVPEDEAEEVRALLRSHRVEFYETEPNRWGISAGGLWTHDAAAVDPARELIESYQAERQQRAKDEWREAQERGEAPNLWQACRAEPVRMALVLLAVLAIAALTIGLPYWVLQS